MTPELRQSIATRARGLQLRMPPGITLDVVLVATEAKSLFEERADELRSRWLALELDGYGQDVNARPLSEVLRVLPGDPVGSRLVAHVAAYRTQRGHNVTPGHAPQETSHFFVEPLMELASAARRLATAPASPVVTRFGGARDAPSLEFGHDVFARILAGFGAALHFQLGDLLE